MRVTRASQRNPLGMATGVILQSQDLCFQFFFASLSLQGSFRQCSKRQHPFSFRFSFSSHWYLFHFNGSNVHNVTTSFSIFLDSFRFTAPVAKSVRIVGFPNGKSHHRSRQRQKSIQSRALIILPPIRQSQSASAWRISSPSSSATIRKPLASDWTPPVGWMWIFCWIGRTVTASSSPARISQKF